MKGRVLETEARSRSDPLDVINQDEECESVNGPESKGQDCSTAAAATSVIG